MIALITDDRLNIRELGLRRVMKSRQQHSHKIRKFQIPKLNFNANDYIEMINWQKVLLTSPPILASYTDIEVQKLIQDGDHTALHFPRFPCHTQAVERCVKLVTEASIAVCGQRARDGFIHSRIESRKKMPFFNTKKDYNL